MNKNTNKSKESIMLSDRPRKHSGTMEDTEQDQFKKFLVSRIGWLVGKVKGE